jgi:lysine-N-methylase
MPTAVKSSRATSRAPAAASRPQRAARYFGQFRCIGGDCEEHCCSGWQIPIDRAAYLRYQTISEADLRERLRGHMALLPDGKRTEAMYATLSADETGACPLLDPDSRLCDLHSRKGAQWLSRTCDTYPRITAQRAAHTTQFLTPSCPEAARLILHSRDALDLLDAHGQPVPPTPLPADDARPGGGDPVAPLAEAIQDTLRGLIRDPRLRAAEALAIFGVVARKPRTMAAQTPSREQHGVMVRLLRTLRDPVGVDTAKAHVDALPLSRDFHRAVLAEIHTGFLRKLTPRPRLQAVMTECDQALRIAESEGFGERFDTALRQWFEPFDDRHPHLLKNYLLNAIGHENFPAGPAARLEHEYLSLSVRLAMIRMYLIGVAAFRGEAFGEADYVRVIQTFSRDFEHNRAFMNHVLGQMQAARLDTTSAAMLLLR